jgi:hypothetical protein
MDTGMAGYPSPFLYGDLSVLLSCSALLYFKSSLIIVGDRIEDIYHQKLLSKNQNLLRPSNWKKKVKKINVYTDSKHDFLLLFSHLVFLEVMRIFS